MSNSSTSFICGTDDFLVNQEAKKIFQSLAGDSSDDLSAETINGSVNNIAEIETALKHFRTATQTLSLFGDDKVVWFKGVSFLGGETPYARAESTKKLVEDWQESLSKLPAGVTVLISAYPIDKRTRAFKWFNANTQFQILDSGKGSEGIQELIAKESQRLGISLNPAAQQMLISKVDNNTRLASNELEKLATFLGDQKEVDEALVLKMVPDFGEGDFFEPVEAFYSTDINWMFDSLKRYFFNYQDARPILTFLQNKNRLLIQLKVLLEAKEIKFGYKGNLDKSSFEYAQQSYNAHFEGSPSKSTYNVFTQNLWYLGQLAQKVQDLTLKKLIDFQQAFLIAFEQLIESPSSQQKVLESMILNCWGKNTS